jgi:type II secretory pathway pseudopilin PulG
MKIKFSKNKRKGFTLLEAIVAIFILLISITGPIAIAQNGLRAAFLSKNQIAAFYLAQDAIEYIKNIKDTNGLRSSLGGVAGSDWLEGLEDCTNSNNGCQTDSFNDQVLDCNPDSPSNGCLSGNTLTREDSKLYYDPNTGFYSSNNASPFSEESIFSRTIYLNETVMGQEAKVTVKIRWKDNFLGSREFVVTEYITSWVNAIAN